MRNILATLAFLTFTVTAAEKSDTYQVTGPIIELTDTTIVVEKGKERHEIARSADTKVEGGELKVGTKVTVKYRMIATSVEVKAK